MTIKIKIPDPLLRSYLMGLLDRRGDFYVASTLTLTGAAICALAQESLAPHQSSREGRDIVNVILPNSSYNERFRSKFIILSPEAEKLVNIVLRKEFDINFMSFMTELRLHGQKIKDIIPLFIATHNLDILDGDIEALKKRYYRKELNTMKKTNEFLRQKAYSSIKNIRKIASASIMH